MSDINALKQRVGAAPFARRLKLDSDGYCACPFHDGDGNSSFHIVKKEEDGYFKGTCFSDCSRVWNAIEFVAAFDHVSEAEAIRILENDDLAAPDPDDGTQPRERKKPIPMTVEQWAKAKYEVTESDVAKLAASRPDSFTPSATALNTLGFRMTANGGAIAAPFRLGDTFHTIKVRYVAEKDFIQWNAVSQTGLFNIDAVTPGCDVYVVESELDAAVLHEAGFIAVSVLNASQRKIEPAVLGKLLTAGRIFLVGDQDKAGQQCMDAIAKLLPIEKTYRIRFEGSKDVGELWMKEFLPSFLWKDLTSEAIAEKPSSRAPKSLGAAAVTDFEAPVENPPQLHSDAALIRPVLDDTALYGLAGQIVKKLQPQTESHPAGNLMELLLSYGNVLGRSAYIQIESTRHYTNEFMVKVGESSRARKGTGKNRIRAIMDLVDSGWRKNCNTSGVGSGEVIVHLIRDPRTEMVVDKKTGGAKASLVDAGVADKRLCVSIGEFQGILAVCHKPEGLLSVIFRDGWDGEPLKNTVKTDPASCMEGHLSIMADTTRVDLSMSLNQADRKNGFANRFLWVYVYRTQLLPMGGDEIDWTAEAASLRRAVEFGRGMKRVFMDKPARDLWCRTLYPRLERDIPGLVGAITSRASAHVLRLALLYALLDLSEHIRREHLEAAYALWQYCEDSVQAIFGELLSPEQMQLLDFLVMGPATKTRLYRDCFQGHRKADMIQNDLNVLESLKKIKSTAQDGVLWYSKLSAEVQPVQETPKPDPLTEPEPNSYSF